MSFAEEAEQELMHLMVKNRNSALSRLEKSNQGESMVLKFLRWHKKPTSPKYIAQSLSISSARIAAVLNSLEKKGQITREMDKSDRRRISVTLTEKGQKAAKIDEKETRGKIVEAFKLMGEKDTKQFISLTNKFLDYSHKISLKKEGNH